MKPMTLRLPPPKILPWIAHKAGVPLKDAEALWQDAVSQTLARADWGTSAFHAEALNRLIELVAAESLRRQAPFFRLSPWFRIQHRVFNAMLEGAERVGSALSTRWLPHQS